MRTLFFHTTFAPQIFNLKLKMKKLIQTNEGSVSALVARFAIAIVIFPHGAQKLLGWFGGSGYADTMYFLTEMIGAPWILAFAVIVIEFFAPVLLIFGLGTRYAAAAIAINFIGVLITSVDFSRFFMNWHAIEGQGEGLEFFVLLFGLLFISLIVGGGKASMDAFLQKRS